MQILPGCITALFPSDDTFGAIAGAALGAAEVGNPPGMESTSLFHVTFPGRNLNDVVSRDPAEESARQAGQAKKPVRYYRELARNLERRVDLTAGATAGPCFAEGQADNRDPIKRFKSCVAGVIFLEKAGRKVNPENFNNFLPSKNKG
jgi:hypothetical protein